MPTGKTGIEDTVISRAIVDTYHKKLLSDMELDVAIAGGGPAGLMAAFELARFGRKVALFEQKLSIGGGMWGGGIGYNVIVLQESGRAILDELGIRTEEYAPGYYTASSIETVASLALSAVKAGASIYNLLSVEDVMVSDGRISGVVVNWSAFKIARLHVDPISIKAHYVIEATGHPLEVLNKVVEKCDVKLATPSGAIEGERSMNADLGESAIMRNTVEIAPGLFVVGMAANAAMGAHRMGPIFGGMLLSGQKAARTIDKLLS